MAQRGDIGGPDDSLTEPYKGAMPSKVNDLINRCKTGSFNLRYDYSSKPSREVKGSKCKGVSGSPWAYWSVDFVDDTEYANQQAKDLKDHDATIINDDPNAFAGYIEETAKIYVFVINKDKHITMESELFGGDTEEAEQLMEQLGYKK